MSDKYHLEQGDQIRLTKLGNGTWQACIAPKSGGLIAYQNYYPTPEEACKAMLEATEEASI